MRDILADTKKGDVLYCTAVFSNGINIVTVDRTTKTTVICGKTIIRRDGYVKGRSGWNRIHYRPITDEIKEAHRLQRIMYKAENLLREVKVKSLSEPTLTALIALLTPAQEVTQ